MNFNEYQEKSREFNKHTNNPLYPALGLSSEAGEVGNIVKKIERDKQGVHDDEDLGDLMFELGDVLWYISAIADQFKLRLDTIAENNLHKLRIREKENAR